MSVKINSDNGIINIDEQVVATLAGLAAIECYGIVGMAAKSATEGFFEIPLALMTMISPREARQMIAPRRTTSKLMS